MFTTLCVFFLILQNAVQSIKSIGKNLSEMGKELETVSQVTSSQELQSKLLEAENAKVEIEAILLKRVRLIKCFSINHNSI